MNRNFWYILCAGFLLVLICIGLMCSPVSAYPRVPQGGIVYWNFTYDISGVAAGYNYLVYMNEYADALAADNDSITYMIELPQQKELYYNYTINDDPFGIRPGYWYRYNGDWDSHVNNRAFRVVLDLPPENWTPNATERQELNLPPPPPVLLERHISDYLVARGDPFAAIYNWSKASAWLFGRIDGIYDRKIVNGTAQFNASEIERMEPGSYKLVYYSPGADRRFDIRITNDTLRYYDYNAFEIKKIDLKPLSPMVVLDRLRSIAGLNDDNFTTYNLEIQEPMIEIVSVDTIMINESLQSAVLQVRGYTNLANCTNLSFVLDEDKVPEKLLGQSRRQNSWNSTVFAVENPGSMRYFDYGVPILLEQMYPGMHNVTVFGPYQTKMETSYWVYNLPEGSQPRNKTLRYVGGYEFVPTPTPEIIEREKIVERVVTQIVQVPVTPSNEQVHAEQSKVQWEFWSTIAGWVFLAIIGIAIVGYAFLVWRRL